MKLNLLTTLSIAVMAAASTMCADFSPAGADELSDLRANQALVNSRIDQLAKPPDAQTADQPTLDSPRQADTTGPGSFPRSVLIPGTSTSVRVGGFVDETVRRTGP